MTSVNINDIATNDELIHDINILVRDNRIFIRRNLDPEAMNDHNEPLLIDLMCVVVLKETEPNEKDVVILDIEFGPDNRLSFYQDVWNHFYGEQQNKDNSVCLPVLSVMSFFERLTVICEEAVIADKDGEFSVNHRVTNRKYQHKDAEDNKHKDTCRLKAMLRKPGTSTKKHNTLYYNTFDEDDKPATMEFTDYALDTFTCSKGEFNVVGRKWIGLVSIQPIGFINDRDVNIMYIVRHMNLIKPFNSQE